MATLVEFATQPEGDFTDEERRCLIHSRTEIAQILQKMERSASRVMVYHSPDQFVLTSFLAVEPELDRLVFRLPTEPDDAAKITSSDAITFVTDRGGIMIKFHVDGADTATHHGHAALVAPLPSALMRLQRREFFRVACPPAKPAKCFIPFKIPQRQAQKAEMTVIDLSLGGLTLTNQHSTLNLAVGTVYKDCELSLPDVGSFITAIEVRNAYQSTNEDGTVKKHSGCRFINPPQSGLTKVQRYTMMLEQRNAKVDRD